MSSHQITFFAVVIMVFGAVNINIVSGDSIGFNLNYRVTWGMDHIELLDEGRQAQLSLDPNSGAGFASKLSYGSGFFHMRVKLPSNPRNNTAGVVVALYLTSDPSRPGDHDELDFEFLGNVEDSNITLQTNVFANGVGNREQRIHLWFDPTADFHSYKILWNQHHSVFQVDNTPIRVFKNNENIGVAYPRQAMGLMASLWYAEWASETPIDWSNAPFITQFEDFNIGGCAVHSQSQSLEGCYSESYWWNQEKYARLTHSQERLYEEVRRQYMYYDYCDDRARHPTVPPECGPNSSGR